MKVVGFADNLRKALYNPAVLWAAQLSRGMLEGVDLGFIPLYHQDLQDEQGFPASVEFRQQVCLADALLIDRPEYNYSLSGVHNAINWISVLPNPPTKGKPVAICATPNQWSTVRAGVPASHQGQGWERFSDAMVEAVSDKADPVVFVLWGAHALKKRPLIDPRHSIIALPHPSANSADKGFLGRPFTPVNASLHQTSHSPIDWRL